MHSSFLPSWLTLRRFNNGLTLVVALLGIYIILLPVLPQLNWWVKEESPLKTWTSNVVEVAEKAEEPSEENRIFIPRLGLDELIHEGGAEALSRGVVRRGHTSEPGKGSNTVIVGHRFTYDLKGVFYHLDKVRAGDLITVHWEEEIHKYTVDEVFVVPATALEIEDPSDAEMLTIYTCTPLWTSRDRLVIRAYPSEEEL